MRNKGAFEPMQRHVPTPNIIRLRSDRIRNSKVAEIATLPIDQRAISKVRGPKLGAAENPREIDEFSDFVCTFDRVCGRQWIGQTLTLIGFWKNVNIPNLRS